MVTVFLGLTSSLSYAISDMLSQRVARAVSVSRVVVWVLIVGALLLVPPALLVDGLPAGGAQWRAAGLAALAGVAYVSAYYCLLAGLRVGDLSLVTSLSGLQGAFTALIAIAAGEHVTALIAAGLVLAVLGGTLAAFRGRAKTTAGAGWALLSGVLFSAVAVLYDNSQALSWLSIAAISRVVSLAVLVTFVLLACRAALSGERLSACLRLVLAGAGVLEVLGLVLFTGSIVVGPLAIAGVMVSQFATFGVLLGVIVLRERPRPHQLAGVACTVAAVSILAASGAAPG